MSDETNASRRTWIFQANPAKYRIEDSLLLEHEELWNLNQHATDVRPGDRVLIWICGKDAGIYAVGTVLTAPVIMSDTPKGMEYWLDPAAGRRPKARVRVRYDKVFPDKPLNKRFLLADPALRDLSIIRSPRGTNFSVTEGEWQGLRHWLNM
jgi:hypothetical protein